MVWSNSRNRSAGYLIENNDYFNRARIYGEPDEYPDNDRRFIFFSRAVFEAARALNIYLT